MISTRSHFYLTSPLSTDTRFPCEASLSFCQVASRKSNPPWREGKWMGVALHESHAFLSRGGGEEVRWESSCGSDVALKQERKWDESRFASLHKEGRLQNSFWYFIYIYIYTHTHTYTYKTLKFKIIKTNILNQFNQLKLMAYQINLIKLIFKGGNYLFWYY